MPSTATRAEARKLQQTTQVALAILAANAYQQAGKLWLETVKASASVDAAAAKWTVQILRAMAVWRKQALEITAAYQALDSGLRSGQVPRLPGVGADKEVSAAKLRRNFRRSISKYAPGAFRATGAESTNITDFGSEPDAIVRDLPEVRYDPWTGAGSDAIFRVMSTEDLLKTLREIEKEWAADATEKVKAVAQANAKNWKTIRVSDSDADRTAGLDARRQTAMDLAARKAGTTVSHNVQSAARDASFRISKANSNVVGWARVNIPINGSSPCAFCALLLSRGATYRTGESAGGDIGGPRQFHPNCRCQAIPLYKGEDYDTMPDFAVNRAMLKLYYANYPSSGSAKDRFNKWRQFIDARNRAARKPGAPRRRP